MKKIIVTLSLSIAACLQVAAQQIPNGDFENVSYHLKGISLKDWSVAGTHEQVAAGPGMVAVKLTNTATPAALVSDPANTDPNTAAYFELNARPDSLKVWMEYNLKPGDTLVILTRSKESNAPYGYAMQKFAGIKSGFDPVNLHIQYPSPGFGDSALIAAYITSPNPAVTQSTFTVRAMRFLRLGGNEAANIANKDFDSWENDSVAYPMSWTTTALAKRRASGVKDQDNAEMTSDASIGNVALKLSTNTSNGTDRGWAHAIPANRYSSQQTLTNPQPGFGVSQRYTFLKGKYKFTGAGGDSAIIQVAMFNNGTMVSRDWKVFSTDANTYSDFTIPIYYGAFSGTPDSCAISAYSSHPAITSPSAGTSLWIDAIGFTKEVNSITEVKNGSSYSIYPNPTRSELHISGTEDVVRVEMYNASGQWVKTWNASEKKKLTLSTEGLTRDREDVE